MDLVSMTMRKVPRSVSVPFVLVAVFAMPQRLKAQFSVYAEGTASALQGGPAGDYLYGGTAGILADGPMFLRRFTLSANVQTRYVDHDGERLLGVAVGPRVSFAIQRLKLKPYAEFMVGFARYRPNTAPNTQSTTDNQWQVNAGLSRRLTPRLELVADYSYSQYGVNNGEYTPMSYSAGVLFHFSKR